MAQKIAPQNIVSRERSRKALDLRLAGLSYQAIGDAIGIDKSTAYRLIAREIDRITEEPAKRLRALESQRLDTLFRSLWAAARRGELGSIDRALKIMERRARLLGLDKQASADEAPTTVVRVEVGQTATSPAMLALVGADDAKQSPPPNRSRDDELPALGGDGAVVPGPSERGAEGDNLDLREGPPDRR